MKRQESRFRGIVHSFAHGLLLQKYLIYFNKKVRKVRNKTLAIFLMIHPGKDWATPR